MCRFSFLCLFVLMAMLVSSPSYSNNWCGFMNWKPGQLRSVFMWVDGRVRHYSLYVPHSYQEDAALVLDFHGQASNKFIQYNASCWKQTADRHGFVVAFPQALGFIPTWNGGDYCCYPKSENDVVFASELVSCLSDSSRSGLAINSDKVFAVGLSNGGAFAGRLVCDDSQLFSGALVMSQSFPYAATEQCRALPNQKAVNVLEVRGRYDVIVPHDFSWSWSLPASVSGQRWKQAQGCRDQGRVVDVCDRPGSSQECEYGRATCTVFSDCDDGVSVSHCSLQGGNTLYDNEHHYDVCEDAWQQFNR